MAKTRVKHSPTERKARFDKAKLDFETGIIEKVATAFYGSAMAELMQTYRWKPTQVKAFLDAVTERTRAVLFQTYVHRVAVNDDFLSKENGEAIHADAPRS